MSPSSLADLLADQLPHGLMVRAQALLRLQSALDRALPATLVGQVRVVQLDHDTLSLACANGAAASRLRHQTDTLIASLSARNISLARIHVSVNPELQARYVHPVEKNGLPASALAGLANLNADMEAGPLKEALQRLLAHHQGGS